MSGSFYFAWVNPWETTFDAGTMLRFDEDIFSFELKHDEGQVATLSCVIKNPRIGLLNASRKLWAWLAYRKRDSTIKPLFFGTIVSVPGDMFAELITIKFNARPHDYIERKQAVAEALKIRPYYDPVFLDEAHRDDPDAILEGWSKLYHVDRTSHTVTVSDILEGEDGTVTFDAGMGFRDSVKMELGECPLDMIQVQADVKWTQRTIGHIIGPSVFVQSYTGASFKNDWPKPGADLGGGWKVEQSYVNDVLDTEHAINMSLSSTATNQDPDVEDCSWATTSVSVSFCLNPGISVDRLVESTPGICDPLGDSGLPGTAFFNPDAVPVNRPSTTNITGTIALQWILNCRWNLRYEPKRDFTETVVMNVSANLQKTVTSPTVNQSTELIKLSGADVGLPLVNTDAWSDFAGQFVGVGVIISPNDPTTPGGRSYQISVTAGTAGTVEPVFSDIPGTVTNDGPNTLQWSSLGEAPPTVDTQWSDSTPVPLGEIVVYEPKQFSNDSGQFEATGDSCFLMAMNNGTTNSSWVDFQYIPTLTSNDQIPAVVFLGVPPLPQQVGGGLQLPVITSYIPGPGQFNPYAANIIPNGVQVSDGSVQWLSLGRTPAFLGIPIGGSMTNVTSRSYFAQDRGHWSVEHLICKARARLRLRARAVKVQWDSDFEDCLDLSLRKNATLEDPHIPGGVCTGKITSYTLKADNGLLKGHVEIGCPVGFAGSVSDITGTPEYASPGYAQIGYQQYDGGQFALPEEDIAYTPPVFKAFDDGLVFPLQGFPGRVIMTQPPGGQAPSVTQALAWSMTSSLTQQQVFYGITAIAFNKFGGDGSSASAGQLMEATAAELAEYALEAAPKACEIMIHPVVSGPFNGAYAVQTTTLEIPQGINLAAASS